MLAGRRAPAVAAGGAAFGLAWLVGAAPLGAQPATVVFDGSFGNAGPAHFVPDPDGLGVEYQIDYCPSCDAAALPGGSHGQLVGTGLFQSFERLDVPAADAARFAASEPGAVVEFVFNRVTGGDPTDWFGAIRSDLDADIFLLNPSGAIIGPDAALEVNGSFHLSTADEVTVEDALGNPAAFVARPGGAVPVIQVATARSFGFWVDEAPLPDGVRPATIEFRSPSQLSVPDGESLSAIGRRIELRGRGAADDTRALESVGGIIQLAAVPGGTDVPFHVAELDVDGLAAPANDLDAAVHLTDNAIVEVSGRGPQGAARIVIRGGRFELAQPQGVVESGLLSAFRTDAAEGDPPAIDVEVAGVLRVDAGRIRSQAGGVNFGPAVPGGDIRLVGREIVIADQINDPGGTIPAGVESQITGFAHGVDGPDIHLEAERVSVLGGARVHSRDESQLGSSSGQAGDIHVLANDVEVSGDGSQISTQSRGFGSGAVLRVDSDSVELADGGRIEAIRLASICPGVICSGALPPDFDPGKIEIAARRLDVRDRARIQSITSSRVSGARVRIGSEDVPLAELALVAGSIGSVTEKSTGAGGDVEVHADAVRVESSPALPGITPQISALAAADAKAGAQGGDLRLYAGSVELIDGGQLRTTTDGPANGGRLEVHVTGELLTRGRIGQDETLRASGLFARSGGPGAGGDLEVWAHTLRLEEGAEVSARAENIGPAGNVDVHAERVVVRGTRDAEGQIVNSTISTRGGNGPGGALSIETAELQLVDGGVASATTIGASDAGKLSVLANTVEIAGEESGLFAQTRLPGAAAGDAGGIDIAPRGGERLSVRVRRDGTISVQSFFSGAGGDIVIRDAALVEVTNGGSISARVNNVIPGPGEDPRQLASDIRIERAGRVHVADATITAETSGSGFGGAIHIDAEHIALWDGAAVTARSTAGSAGDAGDITLAALRTFRARNASVTTNAEVDGGGGRIGIQAGDLVHLQGAELLTNVEGADAGENAGDIDIPLRGNGAVAPRVPRFVVIDESLIQANAVATNAGNVTIEGQEVVTSRNSVIEATSEIGIDGEITISPPDASLVGQLTALPSAFVDPADRLQPPCLARTERTGSFLVQTRPAVLPPPDAPLPADLVGDGPDVGAPPLPEPGACLPAPDEAP